MSYYFKNTESSTGRMKAAPNADYNTMKAAFLDKLGAGISSKKKAAELRRELVSVSDAAREQLKKPGNEILSLLNAYKTALDKAIEEAETKYSSTFEEAEKVKAQDFIDPITPELEATVNSLALTYINELHAMKGQTPRRGELFKKALTTREGALALLRVPGDLLPSRIKSDAAETSKSVEKLAFEEKQKAELARLGRECSAAYSEGFHMRTIQQSIEQARTELFRQLSGREAEAV